MAAFFIAFTLTYLARVLPDQIQTRMGLRPKGFPTGLDETFPEQVELSKWPSFQVRPPAGIPARTRTTTRVAC